MSRSFLRWTVLSAVLAWAIPTAGFGRPLPERQPLHLRLALQWCDPHGLFELGRKRVGRDLSALFQSIGVELQWQMGAPDDPSSLRSDAVEIQVVLVSSESSEWNLSPRAMGAVLSKREPQRRIYVFFNSVVRTLRYSPAALRGRWPTQWEERNIARALSRVIAHEVVHAVLPKRPHAAQGLTRHQLDRASLIAERASIDPAVAQAFRDALEHFTERAVGTRPAEGGPVPKR